VERQGTTSASLMPQEKIPSVVRLNRAWLIPKDAQKPTGVRAMNGRKSKISSQ